MTAQLSFDGLELQAVDYEVKTPTIKRTAGEMGRLAKIEHDFTTPQYEEEFDVFITYRTAHIGHGADLDEEGNAKSPLARDVELQAVRSSFKILAHRTREDVERAWDEAHGATG